ncbi:MAG: radical SAM protein [Parcubacteria group bacterium]
MLLGQCDMCCPFCFGPKHEIPPMKTKDIFLVIKRLKKLGARGVVFTGGEPSLISDLPKILAYAKKLGLLCVLSTNGSAFHKNPTFLKKCASSLDWISLPIDSTDPVIGNTLRKNITHSPLKHFETTIDIIRFIQKNIPRLKIKIGTVVTKLNQNIVCNIPNYLSLNKAIPDTWKIYQISPSEYGKINYSTLRISNTKFEKIFEKCAIKAESNNLKNVQKYSNVDRPGKYLFVNPQGELLIVDNKTNNYQSIGNILRNSLHNLSGINDLIKIPKNIKNFNNTYPS